MEFEPETVEFLSADARFRRSGDRSLAHVQREIERFS